MALMNLLDPAATRAALTTWLARRLADASDVEITDLTIPQSAGMSMTTVLFTAAWRSADGMEERGLVARVAPSGEGLFKDTDLAREYRLFQALHGTPVPVPEPYWLEEDSSVVGSPFMVVGRVDGQVPPDDPPFTVAGWCLDLDLAGRRKLFDGAVEIISRVHALDWQQLGVRDLLDEQQFGALGNEQQIAHWEDVYAWAAADGGGSPTIDAGLAWVKANCPPDDKIVLNWGDARPGNIIYGNDLEVQAVLDWEMATLASPQTDIGWLALIIRYNTEGIGVPLPEGMPTREQMVARYEEVSGTRVPDLDFYEAFAALKLSLLFMRVGRLMVAAGKLPSDNQLAVNNPPSQILAKLTGGPSPAGDMTNFAGNR